MPGHHVAWNKNTQHTDKLDLATNKKAIAQNKTVVDLPPIDTTNTVDNSFSTTDKSITASVGNNPIIITHDKSISFQSSPIIKKENKISVTKTGLKKRIKKLTSNQRDDYYSEDNEKVNGRAIAGFVCSVLGLLLCFTIVAPVVLGTIGTILSALAMQEIKEDKKRGRGLATAGFTIRIIDIVLVVGFLVALFFALAP